MNEMTQFYSLFISDIKRRLFKENQIRIHKCLELISDEQLWYTHNEHVNSIGNLILHLCGNITQYICSGIFREPDGRQRDQEFELRGVYDRKEIGLMLNSVMTLIEEKIDLITPTMLLQKYEVQGFQENGVSILIHITEHFSYHVGQITYVTKLLNDLDTGYYAGLDLNAKST